MGYEMGHGCLRHVVAMSRLLVLIMPFLSLALAGISPASARDLLDMTDRRVVVPDRVDRVFSVSPPGTYLIYALDPGVIAGLNFPLFESEKRYMAKSYQALPVIGGMVGQGRNINQEVLLASRPDVIVIWTGPNAAVIRNYEEIFARMKVPWFNIRVDSLNDYPRAILSIGDLLGRKERAAALHAYAVRSLKQVRTAVAGIPAALKPKIYYAEGMDGLTTEPAGSWHTELIEICGGINVHKGKSPENYGTGMDRVSLEQVMLYDPDIMLIKEKAFYEKVCSDPRWKRIRAVREKRCCLIPHGPFNWFDRPPSFMRLLGAKWLTSILHPGRFRIDMEGETKAFYRLFLGVDLKDRDARELLRQ